MKDDTQNNAEVIRTLFVELDKLGAREFCVAAGARNAPLIAALMERGSHSVVRHFFEERSAAFFALGRVMAGRCPVAVVTTSGTAAGELLPAMMEAHYQALPLIAITADRPPHYRGSGAPQAVEQQGIFGKYVSAEWEGKWIADPARGYEGPMHFNVCLEEGLTTGEDYPAPAFVVDHQPATRAFASTHALQEASSDELVLVGGVHPEDVPLVREFLLKRGAPVMAETTSNLLDDEALKTLLLQGGERALQACTTQSVLRIGAVPSWRWWRDLEDRPEVRVVNICRAPFRGLARTVNVSNLPMDCLAGARQEQRRPNEKITNIADQRLDELLHAFPHAEPSWMRHLSRIVPAGATVFLGNSLPIREWNLASAAPKQGTRFFASRGANGIDGLVSTGLGVGAEAGESWIIVGDLSALYDLSAPWIVPQLKMARRRIVVINNGGGKIFSRVAWLRDLPQPVREVVENRHALNFEHWARLWGLDYRRFDDASSLVDDDAPCAVWEIVPDAAQTEAFWTAWK